MGARSSQRVCDDCASMLTPPEELDRPSGPSGFPAPGAEARGGTVRATPSSWERVSAYARAGTAMRTTASTTVAVAPPGHVTPAMVAVYLALAAFALAAAGVAWIMLSSGAR